MSFLEVHAVSKGFGGIQALNDCSLNVEQSTITGLIGPNGSGKTTLFNTITGYERVDTGTIRFDDGAITGKQPDKIFGLGIGRTFQLTRIFSRLTVLENMHVALPRTVKGLLKHWGSAQEQRQALDLLDFAIILVAQPQLILLDEPAGGVNPTMINELASMIRTLNAEKNITFLVVEHNMEFVMGLCHTVNVMHRGTTIAEGPPVEVRKNEAVLDAYLGV